MKAFCLIRLHDDYPYRAVESGLKSAGYETTWSGTHGLTPDDLLVTWTPWRGNTADVVGERHRAAGGKWVVMENGYLPNIKGSKHYACAINGYNGMPGSVWFPGGRERWDSFGLDIMPWRRGRHVLVIGQMGHNDTRLSMPRDWPDTILNRIGGLTDMPIVYAPKRMRPRLPARAGRVVIDMDTPVERLIESANAVVTWNSKHVCHALLRGAPAFVLGPNSIARDLCNGDIADIERPAMPSNRESFFHRLAWAQWSTDEIARGLPFQHLVNQP